MILCTPNAFIPFQPSLRASTLIFAFTILSYHSITVEAQIREAGSSSEEQNNNRELPEIAGSTNSKVLRITVGEQIAISAKGVRSYSEGQSGIADIRLPKEGDRFVIVGKKPGSTTLLLIMQDGTEIQHRIHVSAEGSSSMAVPQRKNIRLDFYYVELSESYSRQLGLDWPASIDGGALSANFDLMTGGFQSATVSIANQVLPRIDVGESNGWAKIRRHAAMITANGNEVTFQSGGEVNIPINGALTAEVRKISFGSAVQVLPKYDQESGRIELAVHADVSDLTEEGAGGVPGRTVSKIDTVVNLDIGQSLVLAGLDAESEQRTKRGIPGLSQIPILGMLFGSHRKRSSGTKNLVIIVPTTVESVSGSAQERIREAIHLYRKYKGSLQKTQTLRWVR